MKPDSNGPGEKMTIGGISIPFPTCETISLLRKIIGFVPAHTFDSFGETVLAFTVLSRPVCMAKLLSELENCREEEGLIISALQSQVYKSRTLLLAWNRAEILQFNRWVLETAVRFSGASDSEVAASLEQFDARLESQIET